VTSVSVIIPVKDGERYLSELLCALVAENPDEILVIDSGSEDRSVQIARGAGVDLLEIPPQEFGHGRTRNLGAELTRGDLICFLTQDATPLAGWLAAYREAFLLAPDVGAAYGPHIPRPDASPMIARELEEFFASFSPNGGPVIQRQGDPSFLSDVNACYSRACWEKLRFRDLAYAEDQAFGLDLLAAGWCKVYQPQAQVLHSHNYGFAEFMRRYFDEYRGLRVSNGHVEPFVLRDTVGHVRRSVRGDDRWLTARGATPSARVRWAVSSVAHHGGRRVFSALGSRADRLPPAAQRKLSLERRGDVGGPAEVVAPAPVELSPLPSPLREGLSVDGRAEHEPYTAAEEVWRRGPAPLLDPIPGMSQRKRLRIAMLIPGFSRGSGGHSLLFQIFSRLERRGHVCSVWVHDYSDQLSQVWPGVLRHDINEFFTPIAGPVYNGLSEWHGADVVLASGWETVHAALLLERCLARVYLVNDHEPEFFSTSAESVLAADTYRHGLYCVAGSPWLRDLLIDQYGASAEAFHYGVDHDVYHPRPIERRQDTIVYYARPETPRRAVPIGLMALAELHRRRPHLRLALFGTNDPVRTSFPYLHLGILDPEQLSWLYSEATVGLSLSLTNFSLIPKEMMACGLPCVELSGASAGSIFGRNGPLELAEPNPVKIADALERLVENPELREHRSAAGLQFASAHTWDHATDAVEAGIRHALRLREAGVASEHSPA
jgi:glycosyltransferase involved in cell wall biosynthesis/GT2 family glycosyltransferase